jgi:hypothetical protein
MIITLHRNYAGSMERGERNIDLERYRQAGEGAFRSAKGIVCGIFLGPAPAWPDFRPPIANSEIGLSPIQMERLGRVKGGLRVSFYTLKCVVGYT